MVQSCRMCSIDMIWPTDERTYANARKTDSRSITRKISKFQLLSAANGLLFQLKRELSVCGPHKFSLGIFQTYSLTPTINCLHRLITNRECSHKLTFCRRASCDTHALNIPWMILKAVGPKSLKYSLKCSHEAFII